MRVESRVVLATWISTFPKTTCMPLFGYAGTGLFQSKILENGRVRMRGKETGFFTDLETGDVLDTSRHLMTGTTAIP